MDTNLKMKQMNVKSKDNKELGAIDKNVDWRKDIKNRCGRGVWTWNTEVGLSTTTRPSRSILWGDILAFSRYHERRMDFPITPSS